MYGHELHGILPGLGLVVARLQRSVDEEGLQRREGFAGVGIGASQRLVGQCLVQQRQAGVDALAGRALRERGGGGAGRFIQRQGDGIFAKAFLQHKAFGGVDEFVQVFQALLAFFVGAVMLLQAAGVQHMFDGVAQALPGHGFAHHVDQGVKAAQLGPGRAADQGGGIQQAAAGLAGFFLQGFDAAGTDAPGRKVHHAQKAGVVLRVLQQAQVGQGVLDFGAFKKAQAAIHAVGDAGVEQAAFQHAALGVAAVEQGDFLAREAVVFGERLDFLDQPTRFVQIGGRFVDAHRFARALVGGQVFAQALAVVFNQGVGAVQDVAVAAVVAL